MSVENQLPPYHKVTLAFNDSNLEQVFKSDCDQSMKLPLRYGLMVSIVLWYLPLILVYYFIHDKFYWLAPLTVVYFASYFGFIIYATYKTRFKGYYHLMAAFSNSWAGLYAIFYANQFPGGQYLALPVLIFIIFFGSYTVQLRWVATALSTASYTILYFVYLSYFSGITTAEAIVYGFVAGMTLVFSVFAARMTEMNIRVAFIQRQTIREQNEIIKKEKDILLKEVHHRVKNNLQIIVSMINLQLSKEDQINAQQALKDIQSRVQSMSLVHHRLQNTIGFSKISLEDYTSELINNIIHIQNAKGTEFSLLIPKEATVDIETAIPLGLIINEIVTNFFKHAARSGTEVKFSITLNVDSQDENKLTLAYTDNGPGFPEGTGLNSETHLGLELIDSLTTQIDASFKYYNHKGAVYELKL